MPHVGHYHRGSLICTTHELRITQRCLTEDLQVSGDCPLEDLVARGIVRTFIKDRTADPAPAALGHIARGRTDRPLVPLRHRHDHRGATWHEPKMGVVWLCATDENHRVGELDDSFPRFRRLLEHELIYPTVEDYERLERDRAVRFADMAPEDARELLDQARQTPEEEIRGILGGIEEVGVVVRIVETMDELFVAFSAEAFIPRGVIVLSAFAPEATFTDWRCEDRLPRRPVDPGEMCFSIVK
jgi:hypothetical protein